MRYLLCLLSIAFALLSRDAMALPWDICVKYAVDFDDALTAVGDDHITDAGALPARGARIEVKNASTGVTIEDAYAEDSGADVGCLPNVDVSNHVTYTVKVYADASVGGNFINVQENDFIEVDHSQSWSWTPGTGTKVTFTTHVRDWWNIAAAAGWAASRLDGGMSGETWRWYTEGCTSVESCIAYDAVDDLWEGYGCVSTDTACITDPFLRKYLVAHQMGHLSSNHANSDDIADVSITAAVDGACDGGDGHKINSKEHQSSAAYEGIAHAWAAMAFNNYGSEDDCGFAYYLEPNWDNDPSVEAHEFDCDGDLCEMSEEECDVAIDGDDYLADVCGGTLTRRGTELDWLRFWWDVVTDTTESATVDDDDMIAIWVGADPDGWSPAGSGVNGLQPAVRLHSSAAALGKGAVWENHDVTNGVHR